MTTKYIIQLKSRVGNAWTDSIRMNGKDDLGYDSTGELVKALTIMGSHLIVSDDYRIIKRTTEEVVL